MRRGPWWAAEVSVISSPEPLYIYLVLLNTSQSPWLSTYVPSFRPMRRHSRNVYRRRKMLYAAETTVKARRPISCLRSLWCYPGVHDVKRRMKTEKKRKDGQGRWPRWEKRKLQEGLRPFQGSSRYLHARWLTVGRRKDYDFGRQRRLVKPRKKKQSKDAIGKWKSKHWRARFWHVRSGLVVYDTARPPL